MDTELIVGGLQLGALIILVVQTLKFLGVSDPKWLKISPVLTAVFFGALWVVEVLVPGAAVYTALAVKAIAGIMAAVLGYGYAVKPVGEALGLSISAKDIEPSGKK